MRCLVPLVLGFLCLPHVARGADTPPDALPPGAVARLGWSPLRVGYGDFALTPDGRTIVVVTPHGNLRRLDAQTGRLLERRQLSDRSDVDPTRGCYARLSANGQSVSIEERSDAGLRLTVYDVASGKKLLRRESGDKSRLVLGRLSPDGKQLAVVESKNNPRTQVSLRVFDLQNGHMRELGTFDQDIQGIHFSGDGKHLLVAQCQFIYDPNPSSNNRINPQRIIHLNLASGKELWRRTTWEHGFTLSHDGKMMIVSGHRDRDTGEAGFHVVELNGDAAKPTERFVPCRLNSDSSPTGFGYLGRFALAADDRTLAIHSTDEIVLWDLRDRKVMKRFKLWKRKGPYDTLSRLAISSDQRTLLFAAGPYGEYLQRLDLKTGKLCFEPPDNHLPGSLLQLAFTPDGKEIFASSSGGTSARWNTVTGKRTETLREDNYDGTPFVRTPGGLQALRYAYRQRRIEFRVFDLLAQKRLHTISCIDPAQLENDRLPLDPSRQTYALSANGKTILAIHSSMKNSHVTVWNAATGERQSHFTVRPGIDWPISPFSPWGRWVVLGGALHHVGSGTELFALAGRRGERLSGEQLMDGNRRTHGPVWFSEDGRLMAAHLRKRDAKSAAEDALAVWELASGQVLARFANCGFVAQVAFAPDGRTIALLDGGAVRLLDLLSEKLVTTYSAPDVICGGGRQGLVFAQDGGTLATAHEDGSILLWKVPRSRPAPPAALADSEAEKLWQDLGNSSPTAARTALERLICRPNAATDLLAKRFRLPPVDDKIAALINDLDSDEFATREAASRELRASGVRAEAALRRALVQKPSLEMKRRIESILANVAEVPRLPWSGERLRGVRAVEVLERIGNAAARRQMQAWAEQTDDGQLAVEARLALERLRPAKAGP